MLSGASALTTHQFNRFPQWWQSETKLNHSSNASQPAGEPGQSPRWRFLG